METRTPAERALMATSTAICCSRSPTGKAWYQAKKHCERLGEYLASITSDDEQQFPTNRFQFADTNILGTDTQTAPARVHGGVRFRDVAGGVAHGAGSYPAATLGEAGQPVNRQATRRAGGVLTCAFREGRAPDAKRCTALKALEPSQLYPISVTLRQLSRFPRKL